MKIKLKKIPIQQSNLKLFNQKFYLKILLMNSKIFKCKKIFNNLKQKCFLKLKKIKKNKII